MKDLSSSRTEVSVLEVLLAWMMAEGLAHAWTSEVVKIMLGEGAFSNSGASSKARRIGDRTLTWYLLTVKSHSFCTFTHTSSCPSTVCFGGPGTGPGLTLSGYQHCKS
jgi:hypothetical protein